MRACFHRYGLVYPGVGWILFRSKEYLPESLVFHDNYLGTGMFCFMPCVTPDTDFLFPDPATTA